jgi:heptaprenyl diphosphate synthase
MWILWWGERMSKAKKIAFCAVMIALALALSYAERFIPLQLVIPLPGVKLGLANVVTLVALYRLKGRYAFAILLPRCVLGAVFGGGITGLMFSLTGGILALLTMLLAQKASLFSVYGVSILGAAAHHIGQILAAMVLLRSVYVAAYLPWLLIVSIVTGILTGAASAGVLHALSYATVSTPVEMSR